MRQILKTFTNSSFTAKPLQFRFATQTKNVFVLPKKHFIPPAAITETICAIQEAYTVRMISYLFRDNIKYFLDLHVSALYEHIYTYRLEIDDTMYSIIIPITIEYVNVYTIQNAQSLGQIAICAAKLNLQSEKLWEAILRKLDAENIYRYLNHTQVALLLNALVEQGTYINHPLVAKLSGVVTQQKAYYQNFPELLALIRKTTQILQEKAPKALQINEAYKQVA